MPTLYKFQEQAIEDLVNGKHFAILGTGCGKLAISLNWAQAVQARTGKTKLLVVTTASKRSSGDVEREIEIFTPALSSSLSSLSVISWHGLDKWKRQHLGELAEWIYIFDEAKCQAGVSSQMGRAFLNITRATSDWTLYTATPGDTWIKFYPYFQATGKTRNKTQFMYDYAIVQTYKGYPEITGYRRVDELKRFWSEISTAPDTSQMNKELPPETHKTITFKPSTTYFKTLKTRKVERDGEEVMLDTAGALTSELRRQCFTKQKQQWVSDFVENIGTNAILFYNFTQTGDLLQEIVEKALKQYKGARVWRIDGRHHEIPTAETIGKYDIILCQWQAGAEGLNLQYVAYWVGVEMTYSYSTAKQARGRIARIGQTNDRMFYYYLKTENSIESAVYDALKNKSEFAEDVWLLAQDITFKKGDQNDT